MAERPGGPRAEAGKKTRPSGDPGPAPTPGAAPVVTVIGYLSLDEILLGDGTRHRAVPGGAALYAALGAAAAGARARLVAAQGADFPAVVLADLPRLGVDVAAVARRPHPTRRTRLAYSGEGRESAHYRSPEWHAATEALAPPGVPAGLACDAVVLTAMRPQDLARHLEWARGHRVPTVVDTSEVFAGAEPARLLDLVGAVDLFAPSREETRALLPGLDDDAALRVLARRCPRVVQKRGAEGLLLMSARHPAGLRCPARPAAVVDPTGAGDAAVGALGAGVARGLDDGDLLDLAVAVAQRAIGAVGPAGLGLDRTALVGLDVR